MSCPKQEVQMTKAVRTPPPKKKEKKKKDMLMNLLGANNHREKHVYRALGLLAGFLQQLKSTIAPACFTEVPEVLRA